MEKISKILVIDDSQYDRKAIKMYLEADNDNYKVIEAITKKEGIEMIKSSNPDCIILDYILPDGDGLQLLDEIKTTIPIVLLTNQVDDDLQKIAKEKGVVGFLTKESHNMLSLNKYIKSILNKTPDIKFEI